MKSDDTDPSDPSWLGYFEALFYEASPKVEGAIPARIIREDRGFYRATHKSVPLIAEITGAYRFAHEHAEDFPAVGDWVVATRVEGEDKLRIHEVLQRKTSFKRVQSGGTSETQVVAANVDTVFIVVGVDGDFSPRRVERYIALAYESGARPVVILSKSDLTDTLETYVEQIEDVAIGVPIHPISSIEKQGVGELDAYLNCGETVACLGSSGAGKSTLINVLLGDDVMSTGSVREDDSRGRHTTTHRQLVLLPNGCSIIDTPGMRELQLTGDEGGLDTTFEDIEALVEQCRFSDCGHGEEPGCSVQKAIDLGNLEEARFDSYLKLKRELSYQQRRQSESFSHDERKRNRDFTKMCKRIQGEKHNR